MTAGEVAEYLGVPIGTVYQWNSRGGGPPRLHVGRYVRYRPEELEAWLAEREVRDPWDDIESQGRAAA